MGDRQELRAWEALLVVHRRAVDVLDGELRELAGLGLDDYDVLHQLVVGGGERRMGDLAAGLLVSRTAATRLVDRLVARGWVEREIDPADRRAVVVRLTGEGRRTHRRSALVHVAGIERVLSAALDAEEIATLAHLLGEVASQLDR